MPDQGLLGYLLGYLVEIGEAEYRDGLMLPLSWSEIKAWADLTLPCINPRELLAVARLSAAYANQYNKSNERDQPPPHAEMTADSRLIVAEKLSAALRIICNG